MERGRFLVTSETTPGMTYLVDMLEHYPNGWCSCDDWEAHQGPALKERPGTLHRCKHIQKVIRHTVFLLQSAAGFRLTKREANRALKAVFGNLNQTETNHGKGTLDQSTWSKNPPAQNPPPSDQSSLNPATRGTEIVADHAQALEAA